MVSLVAIGLAALLVGTEAFFTALSVLNLRHEEATVEAEREWVIEELGVEDPGELLDYNRATTGLSLLRQWLTLLAVLFVLFSGAFADAVGALAATGWPPLAQGAVFFGGVVLASQLWGIPFDLVNAFVIEEIWGFNNQSLALWARDQALGSVVGVALAVPLLTAVVWFVGNAPYWPAAAWALFVGFVLAMQILKPRVIDPPGGSGTSASAGCRAGARSTPTWGASRCRRCGTPRRQCRGRTPSCPRARRSG